MGIAMYANETYIQELSDQGYPGALSEVYEENCFFSYNVFARVNLVDNFFITPYLEARLGAITFFSDKVFEDPYSDDAGVDVPDHLCPETSFHGTSFQFGAGWGAMVDLNYFFDNFPVSIDFGLNYTQGSNARYRNVDHEQIDFSKDTEHFHRSTTNNVTYRLGLVLTEF